MKKFLSFILVVILCISVFAACDKTETPAATLNDAKTYLSNMYKDSATNLTNDYDLVGKVIISGVSFTVTWTVDISEITIKESDKESFWTVDLPDSNTTEKEYVLTATIKDADGATATVTLNRTLPVYEKVAGVVTNPVAETAYKLFFKQVNVGKTLFLTAEDTGKFIKTVVDPKSAPDFYVEAVDGGVKIYTMVDGAKSYIAAAAVLGDDGKVSKSITFKEEGSVFTYNKTINAWYTVIDNIKYCMGTYSTYDTVSISEDSYYTAENTGVEQFPVEFILKADGEAMAPTEGPADPTELTSITDAVAIGAAKEHNTYTVEKYLVKGTVTEVVNTTYGNLYIADDEGNSIYIYGLYNNDGTVRFDAMENQPKVGDVITVMSIIGQYNDTPQLKNAWVMNIEAKTYTDAEKVAAEKEALTVNGGNAIQLEGEIALPVAGTTHDTVVITWSVDTAYTGNAISLDATTGKLTVTLQDAEETVKLIATIKSGDITETKEITVTIAAKPSLVPSVVTAPAADTAYKFYLVQLKAGKTLYLDGGVSGRYLTMTTDASRAIDVYAETVEGGFKFYTLVENAKQYIVVYANDEGKTSVKYDAASASVFTYAAETFCWKTTLDGTEYYLGTYNTFETVSASQTSYIDAENTRVSQFPLELATMIDRASCEHKYTGDCDATCDICGGTREVTAKHTLAGECDTACDVCGAENKDAKEHTWTDACDAECNVCKATRKPADHVYDNACDAECNICKATRTPANHVYSADCDTTCDVCKAERKDAKAHTWDNACDTECNVCKATRTTTGHVYDNETCDKDCNECGATRPVECVDENNDGVCDKCENDMPGKADIEKSHIAHEKAQITIPTEVTEDTTITLPAAGTSYTDVTVTWTATGATIADGKVALTLGDEEQTVTLTATFTCGDTTETATYTVKVAAAETTFPQENTAYKLFVYHGNNSKNLYFIGDMVNTYYFGSSENVSEGVDIYFEAVDGGYNMYFIKDTVKNYISVVVSGTHVNAVYAKEDSTENTHSVFTYNEEYDTMVTEVNGATYYIGAYGTYNSISPSEISYAATQFVSHYIIATDSASCTHVYAISCASACYLCGAENANPVHNFADATCTAPKTCSCGETEGEKLGHNYVNGVCNREGCGAEEPASDFPSVGTEYYLASANSTGELYFAGTLTNGRIDATANKASAVKVILEAGDADGEYYIYFMKGTDKTYIGTNSTATSNKTAQFKFVTEKDDECVWLVDTEAQTIVSKAFTGRGIGTQTTSTYNNFSTYATSNTTGYDWAWFE